MLASICVSRSLKPRKKISREVKRLFTGFQTNFVDVSTNMTKYGTEVAERSRDSVRRSRDRRSTVKQGCFNVSSNSEKFWKKSLNGQATVVGDHATVSRLSNDVFSTLQPIRIFFLKKNRWTVTQQWSEVTRPSADCQTTFLDVSSNKKTFLKKVAGRSRDSGRKSRDRRQTVVFWTFQAIRNFFVKSRWMVTRQWSEVTRPSADCQTTFFGRSKRFERILKKSRWTVTRQWSEVTRPSADCQTTFFWTFQAIGNFFEKSRWTVTRQWSEVTRPSTDCQTTFFGRFKQFEIFLKKVAERSRDSGRRSRDPRLTVKQRFLDVSSN